MNAHRLIDGIASVLIIGFLVLEYVFNVSVIPETAMSIGDVGLHLLIFGSLFWHTVWERLNNHGV